LAVDDPVGPKNDELILEMAKEAKTIVLAFGQPPKKLKLRGQELINLLKHHCGLSYLRLSKDGTPSHPLYLPSDLTPQPY